jgi:hypothetical protein
MGKGGQVPLLRRRIATALLAPCTALALCAAAAGCSELDEPGPGLTRNDLVADLAAQMSGAADLTYEAGYRLSGGAEATIAQAQKPARSAYIYPGGRVTVTADATTECRTVARATTCTMTAPATPTSPPPAKVFEVAGALGMVTPATVQALLNAAVVDADVAVQQHDTTIAGRHATCVELAGVDDAAARDFTACVTNEGVLGSFSGTLGQTPVEVAMTRYGERVEDTMFQLPTPAKLIDRRGS